MDAKRFDAIAKILVTARSRRWTRGGLLAGTLGLLASANPEEVWSAKSGKCKQPCAACEQCDKGKCQKKNGKKRCRKGKCKPLARLAACAPGQMRNPVTCGCCSINGQTCSPAGPSSTCCSGRCGANGSSSGTDFCSGRFGGQPCDFSEQCLSGICNNGTCTTA